MVSRLHSPIEARYGHPGPAAGHAEALDDTFQLATAAVSPSAKSHFAYQFLYDSFAKVQAISWLLFDFSAAWMSP